MSPKLLCDSPSRDDPVRPVCRSAIALAVLLSIFRPAPSCAAEEKPVSVPSEAQTFDRFDRIILRLNGIAGTAYVESRHRRAARQEDAASEPDDKHFVELRFSHGMFENLAFGPKEDEEAAFRRLESALAYRVKHLGLMFKLDEAQQKKLLQAGRGDLQRVRDQIKELKKRLAEPGLVEEDDPAAVRVWAEKLANEAVALRGTLAGEDLFHKGSMLEKVLRRQLSAEQIVDYEEQELRVRPVSPQPGKKARTRIEAVRIR